MIVSSGCGAPDQSTAGADTGDQTVVAGKVRSGGQPVGGAFVRLLNPAGEFTAEVVSAESGDFRFYAAEGTWTVRALHRDGSGESEVAANGPGLHEVEIAVA
ncbi:Protein of unknown function [Actinopolyspora lacussalsi subsp. righensis]|uniref:DUF1416 domain-containing protein n=2 Tax=Actinopolyspora alba group TaxID=2893675 RepID=A0A1I2ANQ7_9ACTN|nr:MULTISPECIES: DUF1416 domain-containing protein [Actinopolyspora alba group]SFE45601.1 Protein of unknown function [Actinopolyspora alba]SFT61833.1 Protein of unknown function [Actinopolyspora righensis]